MKLYLVSFLLCLLISSGSAFAEKSKMIKQESPWLSKSGIETFINKLSENRLIPYQLVGKIDGFEIKYKGYFMPQPEIIDRFYAKWGMSSAQYNKAKTIFENEGYKEYWHQQFKDSIDQDIHQVIWVK